MLRWSMAPAPHAMGRWARRTVEAATPPVLGSVAFQATNHCPVSAVRASGPARVPAAAALYVSSHATRTVHMCACTARILPLALSPPC